MTGIHLHVKSLHAGRFEVVDEMVHRRAIIHV